MDVEQAVPVIANVPAWVRRRHKRSRARRVIENLLEAATVDVPKWSDDDDPKPSTAPATPDKPAVKSGAVDSAIFVGSPMPPYGAIYHGTTGDVIQQIADDLADLSGKDPEAYCDLPQNEVNNAIDNGGILVLFSKRNPVAVYATSFANNSRLTPADVTKVMRSLRHAVDDAYIGLDDRALVRTGAQLGSYTRTFTLGQILGRQPMRRV